MTRDTLTREHIIQSAVSLLDDEGIKNLSMRRLGQRLGGATTAVYWHIPTKEALLALATDYMWGEIGLPDSNEHGWQHAAQTFARDTYHLLTKHTWLLPAMIDHGAYGSNRAAHLAHCYVILEAAGFDGAALDSAVHTLLTYTFGTAFAASMDNHQAIAAASEVPHLTARLAHHEKNNDRFAFGLIAVLDGLEAQLHRHQQ